MSIGFLFICIIVCFIIDLGIVYYYSNLKGFKEGYKIGFECGKADVTTKFCKKCGNEIENATGNWKYCEDCRNEIFKDNAKVTMKSVKQYDMDGNYIKSYISLSEASRETGISISNISKNLRGKARKAGDYIWKYNKGE